MKKLCINLLAVALYSFWFSPAKAQVTSLNENFDVFPATWPVINNSEPAGSVAWYQPDANLTAYYFPAHSGADTSYAAADLLSIDYGNSGTISSWLLTPVLSLKNGSVVSFWTRTDAESDFPDRLEVRLSKNNSSTNVGTTSTSVGDFSTLLLSINPDLTVGGYPAEWTQFFITLSGITGTVAGRIAFRYFVTDGGPFGTNSDYIGLDDFSYASTLPVTFMDFNGVVKDNKVLLTWATSNELNNKGYDVERSINGKDFSAIGFVKSIGSTTDVNNYAYNDIGKLPAGILYYRLKQIDLDGAYEYSGIIKVNIDTEFSFNVYPNPAVNNSWVQFQLPNSAKVSMQLVSSDGKILSAVDKGLLLPGTYSIPLTLNNTLKGSYFVRLYVANKMYTQKILK